MSRRRPLAGRDGQSFRRQTSATLIEWRREMKSEALDLSALVKDAKNDTERDAYIMALRSMIGRIARCSCILRDRWDDPDYENE